MGDEKLHPYAKLLYVVVSANMTDGKCLLTMRKLGQIAGLRDPRTASRYMRQLVEKGWLERVGGDGKPGWVARNPVREAREKAAADFRKRLADAENVGEFLMKAWLDAYVDDRSYEDNARPDFLKNPQTGENLEYDRYYHGRSVAFEFNGPQHYGPTRLYPDTRKARERRTRDLVKKALSVENRIELVIVHARDLTAAVIKKKIPGKLPVRDLDSDDPLMIALAKASSDYIRQLHAP